MAGGFAPRFTVEAAFLILLAAAAGFADLRPIVIVAVMAAGWLIVALVEYFAWRASRQTALRVAALAERPEPATWNVDEILVPETELEPAEPELAELTTVLPPPADEEVEPEAAPDTPQGRRFFRRRKAAE